MRHRALTKYNEKELADLVDTAIIQARFVLDLRLYLATERLAVLDVIHSSLDENLFLFKHDLDRLTMQQQNLVARR